MGMSRKAFTCSRCNQKTYRSGGVCRWCAPPKVGLASRAALGETAEAVSERIQKLLDEVGAAAGVTVEEARLREEVAKLKEIVKGLAERVAAQSELLSRRAEHDTGAAGV